MSETGKERFARLCWLVNDAGSLALRSVFDSFYSPVHFKDTISKAEVRLLVDKLLIQGKITEHQQELLYPKRHRVVSSKSFKFDMLVALLQNICHMSSPYPNGWNKLPLPDDKSLSADITRIKVAKDQLLITDSVLEEEFEEIWSSVTEAVLRLTASEGKRKIFRIESEILGTDFMQNQFIQQLRAKENPKREQSAVPDKTKKLLKQRSSMSPFKDIPNTLKPGEGIPEEDVIVLTKLFKLLIESVTVEDVLPSLERERVLDETQSQKLVTIHNNAPRMRYLLSVIQTSHNQAAFKLFCEAIKDKYPKVHAAIVKTRHQIYKEGIANQADLLAYCKNTVIQRYKSLYSQTTPLPWEGEITGDSDHFFIPLHVVNNNGDEVSLPEVFPKRSTVRAIVGSGGCGKTSLCKMIARSWANNPKSFQTDYDLVFYIDLHRCQKYNLLDSVYHQILPDDFRINRTNLLRVLEANTDRILFILDGYSDIPRQKEVDAVLKRSLFKGCSVLLVTYPSCGKLAENKVDSFLYCEGLPEKNIVRCIKTYTNLVDIEEKPLTKFLEALKSKKDALRTLKNPLACTFLTVKPDDPLPDFEHLSDLNWVLENFLKGLIQKFVTDFGLLTPSGKVLDVVDKTIKSLEGQSYRKLLEGQMMVTKSEMESFEVESLEQLGIFSSAGSEWLYQCSLWRDYLAARYLSQLEDVDFKEEMLDKRLLYLPQFEQTIQLLCGIQEQNTEPFKLKIIAIDYDSTNSKYIRGIAFSTILGPDEIETAPKRKGKLSDFSPSLSALSASGNHPEMLNILAKSLPPCITAKSTHMFPNNALLGLSGILRSDFCSLVELDISLGKLHDVQSHSLLELGKAIGQNPNMKTLRVTWLAMNIAAKFLGAALQGNTSLKLVHVDREKGKPCLPDKDTAGMWEGLQIASANMGNVEVFRFLNCPYPELLGHIIRHLPPTLANLDISGCAFDMVCGCRLAALLEHSMVLTSLDISGVKMGNTEFAAFVSGIKVCPTLQVMRVANSKMGRQAFLALCDSLTQTKGIERLDLSGCHLTTEMGTRLAEITEQVTSLRTLNLLHSDITDEGRSLIEISSPRSLKVLGLQKNRRLPPIIGGY